MASAAKVPPKSIAECVTEQNSCTSAQQSPPSQTIMSDALQENKELEQLEEPQHDVPYFRNILKSETERLFILSTEWEKKVDADIPEDAKGLIRTTVGQTRLLITERFKQFEGLVDNCEFKRGEKETTCTDLNGFWDMIYFQVEDVGKKFVNLGKLEENSWQQNTVQTKKAVKTKIDSDGIPLRGSCCPSNMFLENHGNDVAKKIYEANVPVYYYKPTHKDCHVLREQWIRSKYERKEFVGKGISNISYGVKKGNLFKRGRDNGQYLSRLFILSEMDGTLKYFTRPDAKEPKAVIKVDSINASFQPEKMKQVNGLQITYIKDNRTRNIFVYHSDGQEIVSWFNAIRSAQYRYMQVAFPTASDNEIVRRLTRNFIKEGYMEKTGPKLTDGFKKRWFTLDNRRLMYFKDPLDAFAKGEVFLGSSENGYHVMAETISSSHGNPMWNYGISISTPERTYLFSCETESERESWIHAFKSVISQPMTLREYTIEAQFKRRP